MRQTPSFLKDWGERLRARRLELKLSQEEVATRAGMDQGHVSLVERGRAGLSDENKLRLAAALESTPSELFPFPEQVS